MQWHFAQKCRSFINDIGIVIKYERQYVNSHFTLKFWRWNISNIHKNTENNDKYLYVENILLNFQITLCKKKNYRYSYDPLPILSPFFSRSNQYSDGMYEFQVYIL